MARLDLTGRRFGRLRVLGMQEMDCGNGSRVWLCRCDCGKLCSVRQGNLIHRTVQSCGCLRGKNFLNNDNYGTEKNNTSGITGVCPAPNRMWIAQIGYNGKIYKLGIFKTKEQAANARFTAEQKCKADFLKQRVAFEEEPQKYNCEFRVTPIQAQWLHEHFGSNSEICSAVRSIMIQNSRRVKYVPQPKPSERTNLFTISLYSGERELLDAQTNNLREKIGCERIARSEAFNCCIAKLYPEYGNLCSDQNIPHSSKNIQRANKIKCNIKTPKPIRRNLNTESPIGKVIAESGISVKELSSKTGIAKPILYRYISGEVVPKAENAKKISLAIGCNSDIIPSCTQGKSAFANQDSEIVKAINYSNITVRELSRRTKISESNLYSYISGVHVPRPATLKKISEATGYLIASSSFHSKPRSSNVKKIRNTNHPLMKAIKSAGLTIQKVAYSTGLSRASLYYYMDGEFGLKQENLQKIADFIGCSIDDLKITKK